MLIGNKSIETIYYLYLRDDCHCLFYMFDSTQQKKKRDGGEEREEEKEGVRKKPLKGFRHGELNQKK